MDLHKRLSKMRTELAGQRNLAWFVEWRRADSHRPPGIYQRGNSLELVYEGDEPDPALLARVRELSTPMALTVVCGPYEVEGPAHTQCEL